MCFSDLIESIQAERMRVLQPEIHTKNSNISTCYEIN